MTKTKNHILLTPGPTPVPPDALAVMAEPIFHHRTPKFQEIFQDVSTKLRSVFRTSRPVFTMASSGTGAMEAGVVNFLSPGDEVIALVCGKFGERWVHLAQAYHLACREVKVDEGKTVPPENLDEVLKAAPHTKAVFSTLSETSTGVLENIEAFAKRVQKTNAVLIVDAVSGLAADRLEMDAWGVDVVVSGSQKGLMIPPGLGFIAVSEKAERMEATAKLSRFYYNLALYRKALLKNDTPFTPALGLVLALKAALDRIVSEGYDALISRHARMARAVREGIQTMNLKLFADVPANSVTSVLAPAGLDSKKLVKHMRDDLGVTIAGGQAELAGKIFRLAHMGFITAEDLEAGFEALEKGLEHLGFAVQKGIGLDAFKKSYRTGR